MRLASLLVLIACCACSREGSASEAFALRNVGAEERAKLEAALPPHVAPLEPSDETREQIVGIVSSLAHAVPKIRALALEDAQAIGDPAVPFVDALLDVNDRPIEDKLAAVEVLGAIDTEAAADALARRLNLDKVRDARIRALAARQLAKLSSDHVLPRLLAQLKYETDGDAAIEIAVTLAKHRNYAGVEGLRVLSSSGASAAIQERAQSVFTELAHAAGFEDGMALHGAWFGSDPQGRLPVPTPSPRLRLEMWRCIANLGEFDLRLVDDARFALSRSSKWVAELLALALHEQDAHIRLHVAQSLERMGPRATPACDELIAALAEPSLAPNAAAALGSIGCGNAEAALLARLAAGNDPELRNAAAAALGTLGARNALGPLRDLLAENELLDLRQAAAESALVLGDEDRSVAVLVECMRAPGADAGGAESALERWLRSRAKTDPGAEAILTRWIALSESSSPTELAARHSARAALVSEWKASLTSTAR